MLFFGHDFLGVDPDFKLTIVQHQWGFSHVLLSLCGLENAFMSVLHLTVMHLCGQSSTCAWASWRCAQEGSCQSIPASLYSNFWWLFCFAFVMELLASLNGFPPRFPLFLTTPLSMEFSNLCSKIKPFLSGRVAAEFLVLNDLSFTQGRTHLPLYLSWGGRPALLEWHPHSASGHLGRDWPFLILTCLSWCETSML